ncbi:hypothetical protein FZEAL_10308 [Fusarium zealandicum]|uniref:Uncharacterized protein n=1 Tax=Fusarium zealandicum TaxID=1053134 RepID=A0A8H4U3T1_9HYPO|nr:hypothetical protein FZEAL_10308 [Fusarium zealandicum]
MGCAPSRPKDSKEPEDLKVLGNCSTTSCDSTKVQIGIGPRTGKEAEATASTPKTPDTKEVLQTPEKSEKIRLWHRWHRSKCRDGTGCGHQFQEEYMKYLPAWRLRSPSPRRARKLRSASGYELAYGSPPRRSERYPKGQSLAAPSYLHYLQLPTLSTNMGCGPSKPSNRHRSGSGRHRSSSQRQPKARSSQGRSSARQGRRNEDNELDRMDTSEGAPV